MATTIEERFSSRSHGVPSKLLAIFEPPMWAIGACCRAIDLQIQLLRMRADMIVQTRNILDGRRLWIANKMRRN